MYGVRKTYLSLEEYWEFLQINECAGYGIRNFPTTGVIGLGCGDYWDQSSRFFLAASIAKAEERLEADRWLGFPIRRKYYTRQMDYKLPLYLGKYVRSVGVETEALVDQVNVTLSSGGEVIDPLEFTVAVSFTDPDELVLKYPTAYYQANCDDYYIRPSCVTISGGIATVEVPRCRLLRPEYFKDYKNDNERPNYTNDTYFLDTIDVYRNYVDTSTGTNLVWWRQNVENIICYDSVFTAACEPSGACADVRQLACPYLRSEYDGAVQLEPATYSGGYSKTNYAVRRKPDGVEINYLRARFDRYEQIESSITRAIIAIAHNNMPRRYCSCDVQTLWYEDDTRPLEPPVRLGLGRSTWGLYEAEQIIREFDNKHNSHNGGML